MIHVLWLVPLLPLLGFFVLATAGMRLPQRAVAAIGVGSVGGALIVAGLVSGFFIAWPPPGNAFRQVLWSWIHVGDFHPTISLYLDPVSVLMILVVTFVGFMIHVYSAAFMAGDDSYRRYFANLNLFVAAMLTLVLADNLLLLYLGWEGVGLCSYLLIGHWYRDPDNVRAANKAFIVTRVGDAALLVGLLVIFTLLGTFDIQEVMSRARALWPVGSGPALAAAALLLCGAVGKSAQLPLQVWLPDAMAGPTPVSALIHAATMVTAGVYLIVRLNVLFALAPAVQLTVAVIGAITLLVSGFSGLAQHDIKRVLAYSTISQIGYMFLAAGVGAWAAALFHLMTHAVFKSLLFLSAGVIIHGLGGEHNLFKMGGLRKQLPLTFWCFVAGANALTAVPFISAGFYSKDLILLRTWESPAGGVLLWVAGIVGAVLTGMYTFRLVFLAFFGEAKQQVTRRPSPLMLLPISILAVLAVGVGIINVPAWMGNIRTLTKFLDQAVPAARTLPTSYAAEYAVEAGAMIAALGGIFIAWLAVMAMPRAVAAVVATPPGRALHRFLFADWGMDFVYHWLLVQPYRLLSWTLRIDPIDLPYRTFGWIAWLAYRVLHRTQTGNLCWYAMGVALGAAIALLFVVF